MDTLLNSDNWQQYLITPQTALADLKSIQLTDEEATEIQVGRFIANEPASDEPFVMAYMADGHLLAVLENRGTLWKPHKVFLPTEI